MSEPERGVKQYESICPRCETMNLHRGDYMRLMCYECGIPFPVASVGVDTSTGGKP